MKNNVVELKQWEELSPQKRLEIAKYRLGYLLNEIVIANRKIISEEEFKEICEKNKGLKEVEGMTNKEVADLSRRYEDLAGHVVNVLEKYGIPFKKISSSCL